MNLKGSPCTANPDQLALVNLNKRCTSSDVTPGKSAVTGRAIQCQRLWGARPKDAARGGAQDGQQGLEVVPQADVSLGGRQQRQPRRAQRPHQEVWRPAHQGQLPLPEAPALSGLQRDGALVAELAVV